MLTAHARQSDFHMCGRIWSRQPYCVTRSRYDPAEASMPSCRPPRWPRDVGPPGNARQAIIEVVRCRDAALFLRSPDVHFCGITRAQLQKWRSDGRQNRVDVAVPRCRLPEAAVKCPQSRVRWTDGRLN